MFVVKPRTDAIESLELRDEEKRSMVVLAPARGGMVTRLSLLGRHRFFLDESTLRDATKNVRGGNPILFPSPGKLENDKYARGTLKQHGFARNLPWEIVSQSADDDARVTLRLESNDATRRDFPWDFIAEYTYILKGGTLRIEQRFTNTGKDPMRFGAGFHPYFHIKQSDKPATRIGTKATRAFDNVTKTTIDLSGPIDLTQTEVDLHLLDHGNAPCTLGDITLRGSPEFTHWVVWTLQGKDFVCVEPWTSPGNALNSGERLLTLEPAESRLIWVEYSAAGA